MRWRKGTIHTFDFNGLRRIEVRDDICRGWEWMLFERGMSVLFSQSTSAEAAKRTAMMWAKRRGWALPKTAGKR